MRFIPPPASPTLRKQLSLFGYFVLIALFFWFLIKLSNEYTAEWAFRVEFTDVPEDQAVSRIIDSSLNVQLTARGFELLRLRLFKRHPVFTVNLTESRVFQNPDGVSYIHTQPFKEVVHDMTGIEPTHINISQANILFEVNELQQKEVAVAAQPRLEYKSTFGLNGTISLQPETVRVFGPAHLLDTLQKIYTQSQTFANLYKDTTLSLSLINPKPGTSKLSHDKVELFVPIDQFTEKRMMLNVQPSGSGQLKLFPSQVELRFQLPVKDFDLVSPDQFQLQVPSDQITDDMQYLNVEIGAHPSFVKNMVLNPARVEFIRISR